MEWQPIESAPKNGIKILCWDGEDMIICEWFSYGGDNPGEWDVCHDAEGYAWNNYAPTHWMLLPEAPNKLLVEAK